VSYTSVRRDRVGGGGGGLLTLVHHSVTFRELDSDLLPGDDIAEAQGIVLWLGGAELRIINVYIPPASGCPPRYATDFDCILEDHGDVLVMGDFNAHHPSWFSRTEDDRAAARGVALHDAISVSQCGTLNEDTPTRLPTHGPPSSPDITLISGHLLMDATWSTHTTLGSDHLPITVDLPGVTTHPRKVRTFTNYRRANWEAFTEETEREFTDLALPLSCAQGEKSFRRIFCSAGKHHIPSHPLRL